MSLAETLNRIKSAAESLESVPSSQAGCVRVRQSLLAIKKDCDLLRKGLMEHSKELKQSRRPDPSLEPASSHVVKSPEPEPEPEPEAVESTASDESTDEVMPLEQPKLERAKTKRPVKVKREPTKKQINLMNDD